MANIPIFSVVVAALAKELTTLYPSDHDFKDMLTKICEDAGVCFHTESTADGVSYKLQGFWSAMEKAHTLITTAVKIYRAGPAMDRTDALKLVPHSDQTPDAQPKQKWSTPHAHNRQHSTLLPPVSDSSDRESEDQMNETCTVWMFIVHQNNREKVFPILWSVTFHGHRIRAEHTKEGGPVLSFCHFNLPQSVRYSFTPG
ncbi:uncharacterized protein LOC143283751 isoform X4 [Babylonia areolata]|uniref:uncharacterized protein LOC143283751 isoform X4 n=1 Tax=Babylonia areolata TaxID=304850 RepID=UPI003FD4377B